MKQQLQKLQSELSRDLGAIASGTRPENTGRVKELKKTIARIHTIAHQKTSKKEGSAKNGLNVLYLRPLKRPLCLPRDR